MGMAAWAGTLGPCATWDLAALLPLPAPRVTWLPEERAVVSWDSRVLEAETCLQMVWWHPARSPGCESLPWLSWQLWQAAHLPAATLGSAFWTRTAQGGPGWMPYLKCTTEDIPWGGLYAQRMGISCNAHLTPRAVGYSLFLSW